MIARIRSFIEDLQIEWEQLMWESSPERKELATLRIAAHEKAIKEGLPNPYIHPEKYDTDWELLPEWAPR